MTGQNARRLVQGVLVSLNGVISEPGEWAGPYFGPGAAQRSLDVLRRSAAMVMGRGTYEVFSQQWPGTPGEYAGYLNAMPKYVYSSTLTDAQWTNTSVIREDAVAAVAALKQTPGADLIMYGHGRLGHALCAAGLVDELHLSVLPVFVADGTPFFRPFDRPRAWQLTGASVDTELGVAELTYRPDPRRP
jgi:dihydrofolate reductase